MTPNIGHFQFTHPFAWPMLESLHFIGLCLLFASCWSAPAHSRLHEERAFVDVHRLLPWACGGS